MATKLTINPIIIPNDRPYARALFSSLRHTDDDVLTAEDLAQYDEKTLFYDLFFDPANRYLYALGPPLLNLKAILWPITITVNDQRVKPAFYQKKTERICCIYAKLPPLLKRLRNEVVITFKDGWTRRAFIDTNQQKDNARLTLMTLSKNNRLRWIQDWVYYYRKEFGIDRIILYDNRSNNQSELMQHLDSDVMLLDWNFMYGPFHSHLNQFCQLGALNHCRLRFGTTGYCFNFDIDELLVVADKEQLHTLLKRNHVVRFQNVIVPHQPAPTEDYSFADLTLRPPTTGSLRDRLPHKYIYRFEMIRFCDVHDVSIKNRSKLHVVLRLTRAALLRGVMILDIWLGDILQEQVSWLVRIIRASRRLLELKQRTGRYDAPISIGYYLHYRSITTNWKPYMNRLVYSPENVHLVSDTTVCDIFERRQSIATDE